MRNVLLLLLLANILYFIWGLFVDEPIDTGVSVVDESDLGPPLYISNTKIAEAAVSVGAVLGAGQPSDLAAVVGRSCVTLGPFKTATLANGVLADYEDQDMRASLRATEGQIFVGHWVQIRNIRNRDIGNAMLIKLKEGGLGDAYLVQTDNEGLKISLGLFGEMSRAERVELQAKSLDLPADITPRMQRGRVFFVDIGLPPGKGAGNMIEKYGEDKVLLRDAATCPRSG
jgi:hypothetical protein